MKALIQHNFTSGLGDFIVGIYEYLDTVKTLKNFGYSVELILNINNNSYIYAENFFDMFNKNIFNIFDSIEIVDTPINQNVYQGLTKVYTLGSADAGQHWWDLFISDPNNFKYDWLTIYPQEQDKTPNDIKIFTDKIYKEYDDIKVEYGLNTSYKSIFFRTYDSLDESELFIKYENTIKEIILSNDKIFVCSNSSKIKNKIKKINIDKVVTYDIPYEDVFGNHFRWGGDKLGLSASELFKRSKYTIFDMLTISDSIDISHITEFNRSSNFLIFSKINKIKIIPLYDY
jgi:hypothetical protein